MPISQTVRIAAAEDLSTVGSLCSTFAEMAAVHADRTALTLESSRMSYGELDRVSDSIAGALRKAGVCPGEIVALYVDRSFGLVASMLGVWKAGCAYLPIDVASPASRTQHILSDSRAVVVLAASQDADRLAEFGLTVIELNSISASSEAVTAWQDVAADDLAYVIYTSGSTGKRRA